MGSFSIWHMLILLVVVVLIFGAGRLPNVMGDFAKGIKAFRAGMREDDPKQVAEQPPAVAPGAANHQPPRETVSDDRKVG
jgi:sec-independent protein translocase protein TatA